MVPAPNYGTNADRNEEDEGADEDRETRGPKPKRRRATKESTGTALVLQIPQRWYFVNIAKTKEEAKLSYYNGNPALKMLLRDVQLILKALIVFDYAFPETSHFETIMKDEFNEQADEYVESGSK